MFSVYESRHDYHNSDPSTEKVNYEEFYIFDHKFAEAKYFSEKSVNFQ
jgi:hypothetical protein